MTDTKNSLDLYIELCDKLSPDINRLSTQIAYLNTNYFKNQNKWKEDHTTKFKHDQNTQYILLNKKKLVWSEITKKFTNIKKNYSNYKRNPI